MISFIMDKSSNFSGQMVEKWKNSSKYQQNGGLLPKSKLYAFTLTQSPSSGWPIKEFRKCRNTVKQRKVRTPLTERNEELSSNNKMS